MEPERIDILKRCSNATVFQDTKRRALLAASFPPVTRSMPVTFEGDIFPQFSQKEKGNFLCEVCIPYQKWAMENGQPHPRLRCRKQASLDAILAGTASLHFSGLVQVKER